MLYIGTGDNFLKDQLMPEALEKAAESNKHLHLDLKMQVRAAAVHLLARGHPAGCR